MEAPARQRSFRNLLAGGATLGMVALALIVPWHRLMETNPRAWIYLKGDRNVGPVVQQMAPLKAYLAANSTVGFASTLTREEWQPGRPDFARDAYVMTRYALAPALVRWSADEKVVVAKFPDDAQLQEFARRRGFKIVARSTPGVALLQREEP